MCSVDACSCKEFKFIPTASKVKKRLLNVDSSTCPNSNPFKIDFQVLFKFDTFFSPEYCSTHASAGLQF
jgi:hypothetical protein